MTPSYIHASAGYKRPTGWEYGWTSSGCASTTHSQPGSRKPRHSKRSSAKRPLPDDGDSHVTPWVLRILIATVLLFFVQQTTSGVTRLLYLVPSEVLTRPWTLVTYMFLHGGLGHIFWSMLGLYFFGPRVESRMGSQRFVTLYPVSGVVGALLSVVLAPRYPIVGA